MPTVDKSGRASRGTVVLETLVWLCAAAALGQGLNVTFDDQHHAAITHLVFFVIAAVLTVAAVFVHRAADQRSQRLPERIGIRTKGGSLFGDRLRIRGQDRGIDSEDTDTELKDSDIE